MEKNCGCNISYIIQKFDLKRKKIHKSHYFCLYFNKGVNCYSDMFSKRNCYIHIIPSKINVK